MVEARTQQTLKLISAPLGVPALQVEKRWPKWSQCWNINSIQEWRGFKMWVCENEVQIGVWDEKRKNQWSSAREESGSDNTIESYINRITGEAYILLADLEVGGSYMDKGILRLDSENDKIETSLQLWWKHNEWQQKWLQAWKHFYNERLDEPKAVYILGKERRKRFSSDRQKSPCD